MTGNHLREWLISYGADGSVVIRHLLEVEKSVSAKGHDHWAGGVQFFAQNRDSRVLITLGGDEILNIWEWKQTNAAAKKAVADGVQLIDVMIEAQQDDIKLFESRLAALKVKT